MTDTSHFLTLRGVSLGYPIRRSLTASAFRPNTWWKHRRLEPKLALKNIDIDLAPGDQLGVMGPNGAGKSTLLRIMAGIYEPTSGSVARSGTVGNLLDAGFGLDPVLTGESNAHSYATFLGLSGHETKVFVEDVRAFCQLGEYFQYPIRTYSTGMLTRLVFSLATSVQPDILIMDELIATNDAAFMKTSKERLADRIQNSAILVLASHNSSLLEETCNVGLWLDRGSIQMLGAIETVARAYKESQVNP